LFGIFFAFLRKSKKVETAMKKILILLLWIFVTPAHALLFVSTGQSNANVQLDVNHTQHWTYGVSSDVNGIDGALFTMKRGPSTGADITFLIFQGVYQDFVENTYTALFSKTLSSSAFTQSYDPVSFQGAPINLTAGNIYTAVLLSNTPDTGSTQYFIKGDTSTLTFVDGGGNRLSMSSMITMNAVSAAAKSVPAPGSLLLVSLGVLLILAMRKKIGMPIFAHKLAA
jgi:uncharacterized protein YxeA